MSDKMFQDQQVAATCKYTSFAENKAITQNDVDVSNRSGDLP